MDLLDRCLDLFVPARCFGCRNSIEGFTSGLCARCERKLPWLPAPCCPHCALPQPCAPCPAIKMAFDHSVAAMSYQDTAGQLVTELKNAGSARLAAVMVGHLASQQIDGFPSPLETVVVPVPPHHQRYAHRGFDHADRLAVALARYRGFKVSRCLKRGRNSTRQVGAQRKLRLERPVIWASPRRAPAYAVLVDDVYTTGATLDACAQALKQAGSKIVNCVVYARTLREKK